MKTVKRYISLLLLVVVSAEIVATNCKAAPSELRAQSGIVSVILKLAKPDPSYPYEHGWVWGNEFGRPKVVISEMMIAEGGKDLFVPLSVYSDLANPNKISLANEKGEMGLTIIGGDAHTSYKAHIIIGQGKVLSRKVVAGEFPQDVWEETNYSRPNMNVE